ncbi:MAG: hypothetical protein EBT15_06895 [Betaproteobacteria bacterium]|nr:hypothetical protein [Betaproteobacteria bacterium]
MPRFVDIQTNFSTGELDPLLRSRIDLQQYNNALAKATNVVIQPQGGMRRRPGTKHILELPNSGTTSAANGVRLVPFEFSVDDSYMLCFTHNRIYVIKDGVRITNINASGNDYLTTSITGAMLSELCWTQSADTMILVHPDLSPVKLVRGANDASWTISSIAFDGIPKYAFTLTATNPNATLTPSAVSGNVTLTANAAVFSSGNVNQYVNVTPQGRARIVEYVSTTVVKAVTEYPFFDTSAKASGSWELETGYEDVWSSTKGWPRTVTFHEGRLYFGGSKSRPSTIWGSKIGLFFDFVPTEALDDDAVEATLDTSSLNVIVDMISGRDLQVFTTGGEFYVPQTGTDPITPANLTFKAISRNGTKTGSRVQSLESGTVYIQRQGKSLNEFLFSDTQLTYVTQRISLLSGHLLKTPTRMALRRATSTDEGDLLMMVNGDDGSMAVFSIMRSQQITAPSEFITDGQFRDIGVDVTDIYAVVKRRFNNTDRYFVELFTYGVFTDCAFTGGAAAGASSLPHVGKALNVITDGVPQSDEVVSAGGAVTFDRSSTTSYEVGLPFTVYAKTMPVEIRLQTGTRLGFKKRIVEINAFVDNTQHLQLNNNPVPFRSFDNPLLDKTEPTFTGVKRVNGVLGYSREQAIEIGQSLPLKMTLLGLEYKIAVTGGT